MNALQCEFCGGKLIAKVDGIFECTSCGMLYDENRIQEMVQEITGTVKVEGVTTAHSLVKRGYILLEDQKWPDADKLFERALDSDPENSEAYFGKLLVELKIQRGDLLSDYFYPFFDKDNWKKAIRFADKQYSEYLTKIQIDWNEKKRTIEEERKNLEIVNIDRLAPYMKCLMNSSCPIKFFWIYSFVGEKSYYWIIKADGTVIAEGRTVSLSNIVDIRLSKDDVIALDSAGKIVKYYIYDSFPESVSNWANIISLRCCCDSILGLNADGTVELCNRNEYRPSDFCKVKEWKGIVAIEPSGTIIVGLRDNGTVVTCEGPYHNDPWFREVDTWKDISKIYTANGLILGLRKDGTVVACGKLYLSNGKQYEVPEWCDIVSLSVFNHNIFGLKADGTVVACGDNEYGQCDVSDWKNIVQIIMGNNATYGLRADGTIVACGAIYPYYEAVSKWKNVISILTAGSTVVGLHSDGYMSVFSTEKYFDFKTISESRLFDSLEQLESRTLLNENRINNVRYHLQEKNEARIARIASLSTEEKKIRSDLSQLNGLFTKNRRKELESQLDSIIQELNKLKKN